MLKELWRLIVMLFATRPSDFIYKDLEVEVMNHFPFEGSRYMSWCGKIITRDEKKAVIERFLRLQAGRESKNHEGGHKVQAITEHGDNWCRYYLSYLWHWLKHCPWIAPAHAAYYCNRYEVEAYAMQHDFSYFDLENYTRKNLRGKYSIKNAKKLYKQLGGTPNAWKKYVKSL